MFWRVIAIVAIAVSTAVAGIALILMMAGAGLPDDNREE